MPGVVVHTVISALGRGRQEDQKLRVIDCMRRLRLAKPVRPRLLKACQQRKTSKKQSWVFLFLHDVLWVVLYRWHRLGFPICRAWTEVCSCYWHPEEQREGRKPEEPQGTDITALSEEH